MILRHTLSTAGFARGLGLRCFTSTAARLGKASKVSKELASLRSLSTDDDHRHARTWIDSFTLEDVPKEELDVSYARSSGPGGQHVNKTNSKAVVRIDIHKAKWLPPFVLPALQKTVSFTEYRMSTAGRSEVATQPLPSKPLGRSVDGVPDLLLPLSLRPLHSARSSKIYAPPL